MFDFDAGTSSEVGTLVGGRFCWISAYVTIFSTYGARPRETVHHLTWFTTTCSSIYFGAEYRTI